MAFRSFALFTHDMDISQLINIAYTIRKYEETGKNTTEEDITMAAKTNPNDLITSQKQTGIATMVNFTL